MHASPCDGQWPSSSTASHARRQYTCTSRRVCCVSPDERGSWLRIPDERSALLPLGWACPWEALAVGRTFKLTTPLVCARSYINQDGVCFLCLIDKAYPKRCALTPCMAILRDEIEPMHLYTTQSRCIADARSGSVCSVPLPSCVRCRPTSPFDGQMRCARLGNGTYPRGAISKNLVISKNLGCRRHSLHLRDDAAFDMEFFGGR